MVQLGCTQQASDPKANATAGTTAPTIAPSDWLARVKADNSVYHVPHGELVDCQSGQVTLFIDPSFDQAQVDVAASAIVGLAGTEDIVVELVDAPSWYVDGFDFERIGEAVDQTRLTTRFALLDVIGTLSLAQYSDELASGSVERDLSVTAAFAPGVPEARIAEIVEAVAAATCTDRPIHVERDWVGIEQSQSTN